MQKKLFGEEPEERKIDPNNVMNELTGKEWIQETSTIWYQRGLGKEHPHTIYERQHPAPFPFIMIGRLLKFFTKQGDHVLDPFCGVGSTLKACALNNRIGTGIEIVEKWVDLTKRRLAAETKDYSRQNVMHEDSRKVLLQLADEKFDFVVTSPPYWGILNKPADHRVKEERIKQNLDTRYSRDPNDLANISSYDEFLEELKKVFVQCYRTLKTNKYIAVVVTDFRHKSKYVMYHADIAKFMEEIGFTQKGVIIFVKNAKKLYPYGYPYGYVPNIHHEYILIFKKEMRNETNPK